ncbi:hypothetical protein [Sphaerisporangium fuscum]|uniref:hypothetical protein n=1 Tax=Sphaerisporangium fuscum TaxID=2835868 RepID=UPI0027E22A68|nr:hypothetical protein [Sphaerisporangium fuscum]
MTDRRRWTRVRLSIYPDGGVARFRVHGEPVPDPRFLDGTIDLAVLEHGGPWWAARTRSTPRRYSCCRPAGPGSWATSAVLSALLGRDLA